MKNAKVKQAIQNQCEVGRWVWPKNLKLSCHGSVTGVPCKTAMDSGAGMWWVQSNGTEMAEGLCVCKHEVGRRCWTKNPKPSHSSSISGMLCKKTVSGGAGRCVCGKMAGG